MLAGVELQMDEHWHTYWRNGGGAGVATKIEWQLPQGVTAGQIQWPTPKKLVDKDPSLTTYVYENEVVLLVPLKIDAKAQPGRLDLKAKVSWLECAVECVPGDSEVEAALTVGNETKASKEAELLAQWQKKMPRQGEAISPRASWEKAATKDLRPLLLEWKAEGPTDNADFYPDGSEQFEVSSVTERLPEQDGKIRLRKEARKIEGDWPKELSGLVVQGAKEQVAYEIRVPIESGNASAAPPGAGPKTVSGALGPTKSLWQMLLYAFLGGLILNVMPCVLPVIALKILGFVSQAKDAPGRVRKLGLIYGLGVLVSFLALAGLIIAVKAAGHKAGWGMQFGNPPFLIVLIVLVTLVALNLFGLFEVNLSGNVMGAAGTLASKHGAAGAFFNGVLATILATPCTAPFLSIALGFALAQTPALIALMFLTVGLGLAFPYVVLSWHPAWLKFLPKPGVWMERFKIALGFPMLATAVWLFSIIPVYYGERAWWLGMFLVILALVAWIFGTFIQRGQSRRSVAAFIALALLAGGYAWALESKLKWRAPDTGDTRSVATEGSWQRWSPEAVAKARAQGRPVLVDFTAKWCLTCNAIVKPALENDEVKKKLEAANSAVFIGDYTKFPNDITEELGRHGRAGVPLVLVYSKNPNEEAQVLPDPSPLLPPSSYSRIIVEALDRAVR